MIGYESISYSEVDNTIEYRGNDAPRNTLLGDINGDAKFTNTDLQAFLNYRKSGGGSADPVPEPASWVLACLAFAMVSGNSFLCEMRQKATLFGTREIWLLGCRGESGTNSLPGIFATISLGVRQDVLQTQLG
jgi:hypothetical protein